MDDHQLQLLTQFDEMIIICSCYDIEDLAGYITKIDSMEFNSYKSNTQVIMDDIEQFLIGD